MDNMKIGESLRAAHSEAAKKRGEKSRAVRLPSEENIEFWRIDSDIKIHMHASAVKANMQTNSGGFEGWCLALILWLKVDRVTLYWDVPFDLPADPKRLHYARFLYRVQRFAEMFPDWFQIGTPEHLSDCAVTGAVSRDEKLFLNNPSASRADQSKPNREAVIEAALVGAHKSSFLSAFNLEQANRQFPVGVFRSPKASKADAVFTGGSSAIDITGFNGDAFTLFELKTGTNIMVGALGELLFYANVIRDAAGPQAPFGFCDGEDGQAAHSQGVQNAKSVRGILLVEQLHPLLEHPDLFQTINRAAQRLSADGKVPLSIEGWMLSGFGNDPNDVQHGGPFFAPIGQHPV